jgi:Transposase DDE domain group 1
MTTTTQATSIHKVRRDAAGGKRGQGWAYQAEGKKVRRADPTKIAIGCPDPTLTGVAGLVPFGQFVRGLGVDWELKQLFGGVKTGRRVVYGMPEQLRLLIDANAVGEQRVFGLEALAADPLFVHLAGGTVPSLDTVYRDLQRLDETYLGSLHGIMARLGLAELRHLSSVHLDIDTTVEPLFGRQQGALPGPNPRYHGRPSYHPILGVVAETGLCIGAELRPGDRGLGEDDARTIGRYVRSVRSHLARDARLTVRIDAGADCAEILRAIDSAGAFFIVKLKLTPELLGAVLQAQWQTVDVGADGEPLRQVAEIVFQREGWQNRGKVFRVLAARYLERDSGKQVRLWDDIDYTVQVFVTNDWQFDAEDIVADYDGRAEIEPLIGELKNGLGIGKIPSQDFNANHAAFLLKLITHNLVRRFVRSVAPAFDHWRIPWLWRVLLRVPGRLLRSGRCWTIRLPEGSFLNHLRR